MKVVIDTNVLLVANGQHEDVSLECVEACIHRLLEVMREGTVVIDDGHRILNEYHHKTRLTPPNGVGDKFLKWLLRSTGNVKLVEQVSLTKIDQDYFAEFPCDELQRRFDPADRKFVAVANAHEAKPPIWQGADCKWLGWWEELQKLGVTVDFVCPDDVCRFFAHKYPDKPLPPLPG